MANAKPFVNGRLKRSQIVVFSKSYSPEGQICEHILRSYKLSDDDFEWVDIEKRSDCPQVEDYLWLLSGKNNREVPLLFIKQHFVGGYNEITQLHQTGRLENVLNLNYKDEDAESCSENEEEVNYVTIRVVELDDTEIVLQIVPGVESNVDYDKDQINEDEIPVRIQLAEALQDRGAESEKSSTIEEAIHVIKEPEWMFIGGKHSSHASGILSRETASFIMLKPAVPSESEQSGGQSENKSDSGGSVTAKSEGSVTARSDQDELVAVKSNEEPATVNQGNNH